MKSFFYSVMFALLVLTVVSSCSSRKGQEQGDATLDTLGMAEYQRWKLENQIRAELDSEYAAAGLQEEEVASTPASSSSRSSSGRSYSSNSSAGSNDSYSGGASSGTVDQGSGTVYDAPAPEPEKKRMSHTAKGAIVGAVTGAATGAIANKKNRLGGGVVGGVIGAATGAGIGAIVDKKQRQKAEQ